MPRSLSRTRDRSPLERAAVLLNRPVDALPLDVFRICIGAIALAYFARTLFEVADFSAADGLIDHELTRALFPFTSVSLLHSRLDVTTLQLFFLAGCAAALAIVLGYRVRSFAAVAYVIAVSAYRWNFLVMYVDDVIVHLMLFWLILLPVGRTLVVADFLRGGARARQRWVSETVPGAAVRCFIWNVTLIYLVAGLWKWTSPMWREGTAVYAALKLPVSLFPHLWSAEHLAFLRPVNFAALLIETAFPFLYFALRGRGSRLLLFAVVAAFHVGMVVTFRIPFANLACVAAGIVVFGPELMTRWREKDRGGVRSVPRLDGSAVAAMAFVSCLTLAMLSSVWLPEWRFATTANAVADGAQSATRAGLPALQLPVAEAATVDGLRPLQKPFFAALWSIGIAQQYQLFNWIDERNYVVDYDGVRQYGSASVPLRASLIFPDSTRGVLLQTYVHGVTWMQIPRETQARLRGEIYRRAARRYCRASDTDERVILYSKVRRITGAKSDTNGRRSLTLAFQCTAGEATVLAANLHP